MEISEIWPLNDKLMHCGIFPANKESFTMRDVLGFAYIEINSIDGKVLKVAHEE
jgi:hypothetical protein